MLYLIITAGILSLDLGLKQYFDQHLKDNETKEICGSRVILNKLHNRGAALNLLENHPKLLRVITGSIIGSLILAMIQELRQGHSSLLRLALAFLIGGSLSNAWDRFTKHYVVDYFSLNLKNIRHIVFNIADFCIFFGAALLFVRELISTVKKD